MVKRFPLQQFFTESQTNHTLLLFAYRVAVSYAFATLPRGW